MNYIFFLGSNPSISLAEILAYFKRKSIDVQTEIINQEILLCKMTFELSPITVIRELGGTIKIGELIGQYPNISGLKEVITDDLLKSDIERLHYGISLYGVRLNKQFGLEIKSRLIEAGRKARWVVSRDEILSSVVVEQNKLIEKGGEYSLIKANNQVYVVKTLAVQPFKELSKRDYGRPGRDDHSGMLPPKLAQIMLNLGLVRSDSKVLDPFCGSGTVLSEAMLLGVKTIFGSDISEKAIDDTETNLEWIADRFQISDCDYKVAVLSATDLSSKLETEMIDAIVSEPFLGPQRGEYDVRQVISELEDLYTKAIKEFYKILKKDGRVVMIWPVMRSKNDRIYMSAKIAGQFEMVSPLPSEINNPDFKLTNRNTLLYHRPDQRVWREIVILQK